MKHVLYCYRTDGSFRMITAAFDHIAQARQFLEILWNADPWAWESKRMVPSSPQLMTACGVRIRAETLEEIVAYELRKDDPELGAEEARRARQIMTALPDPEEVHEAVEAERAERKARRERPKIDREGKVTISQIAEELEMDPKEARGILRALKIQKPLGGWLFDPTEVDSVKEKLVAHRKDN